MSIMPPPKLAPSWQITLHCGRGACQWHIIDSKRVYWGNTLLGWVGAQHVVASAVCVPDKQTKFIFKSHDYWLLHLCITCMLPVCHLYVETRLLLRRGWNFTCHVTPMTRYDSRTSSFGRSNILIQSVNLISRLLLRDAGKCIKFYWLDSQFSTDVPIRRSQTFRTSKAKPRCSSALRSSNWRIMR